MRPWDIFKAFVRIGATGFGGMMALIGLIHEHLVEKRKAVTVEEFNEGVAIGQILPGPIAVDAATHIGYARAGWRGAIAATVGIVLPAFLLMLIVTPLYLRYGRVPEVSAFFTGVGPAVVAMIAAVWWRMVNRSSPTVATVIIAAVALGATLVHVNAVLVIVLSGVAGMLVCRERPRSEGP